MKKDVIYIDIEDDITSIIGKVKDAGAKVVALVPPKRIGVLQSVVNLKLLQKAANGNDKHVVLITSDQSLTALAAGVRMPVAKNLQSRPEVPQITALQADNEEVINGDELPVGDVASTVGTGSASDPSVADEISKKVDPKNTAAPSTTAAPGTKVNLKDNKGKKGPKIPNFEKFRKKIFLFGGLGALLLIFLIWAIFFAPHATVTISAKTTAINIDRDLRLDPSEPSDVSALQLKPQVQQLKKTQSVDFDTTGTKDTGNKATGNLVASNSFDSEPITIPAGTTAKASSGEVFRTNQQVTVPGASVSGGNITPGFANIDVTAADIGPEYNVSPRAYEITGYSVNANGSQMGGGTKEKVNVVASEDVEKAKQQLQQQDVNKAKSDLAKQFNGDVIIVQESFESNQGQPNSNPAVGEQAKRAKLTLETTYVQVALSRQDARAVLDNALKETLKDKQGQSVYTTGENKITFSQFQRLDGGAFTTSLTTTGFIGPKIDTKALTERLKGKNYGEIEQIVSGVEGVTKVEPKFWPFWVSRAPGPDKIDIKFSVVNDGR